jgi:hypothetical protein
MATPDETEIVKWALGGAAGGGGLTFVAVRLMSFLGSRYVKAVDDREESQSRKLDEITRLLSEFKSDIERQMRDLGHRLEIQSTDASATRARLNGVSRDHQTRIRSLERWALRMSERLRALSTDLQTLTPPIKSDLGIDLEVPTTLPEDTK